MPASKLTSRRPWAIFLATALTSVVIFLSLGNGLQLPRGWLDFAGVDKLQHLAAYSALGLVWMYALDTKVQDFSWKWLLPILFALGVVLEILQWAFYPQRYFEYADMLANGIGAGLGCTIFNRIFPH